MNISLDQLKKLRAKSQAGVSDCRKALEAAGGDMSKAEKILAEWSLKQAAKKEGRETGQGVIEAYIHANGKIGVLVNLRCETDFVARNDEFRKLAHEIAMQVAAVDPKDVKALLSTAYIRDASLLTQDLIKTTIAKVGENITVSGFCRMTLGG